ncbi:MAG TPA: CvpA family protein [bacterium]|nr:CvpA family protein [bacterium]
MTLDIILGIVIVFFAWRGWRKGLIGEVVETVGVVVAILVTARLYPKLEDALGLTSPWSWIVIAAVIFVAIMIILTLLGKGLRKLLEKASLGPVEKTLGLLFGAFKAGLIFAVLSAVLLRAGDDGKKIVSDSLVARSNLKLFAWVTTLLPEEWEKKVDSVLPEI